jgi:hypothetical protein
MAETSSSTSAQGFDFKAVSVAAPLLASSIALFYDVGLFYALDAGFFTFFSISEHLLFALQSLPLALVPALWLVTIASLLYVSDKISLKKNRGLSSAEI